MKVCASFDVCSYSHCQVNKLHSLQVCRYNQHAVETPDGSFACVDCLKCPPGLGVTIPCGNKISHGASAECQTCAPGYYSDFYSSESCKPCSTCGPNEIMITRCSKTSNTQCKCKPLLLSKPNFVQMPSLFRMLLRRFGYSGSIVSQARNASHPSM